ncbi:EF-P beta-lysylation protein EpmB [Marinobacterium arenosum]|uniref:EF-P beta-lysylation protein EpmB n=1 Tax=Marinobacterium arenosum TaxID=2862496 RepID=UPI002107791E|nr:EF-P beta-lysylation protein EpmB [Marinobacterium arenosum]
MQIPTARWQQLLSSAISDPAELIRLLELPVELVESARRAAEQFPLRVPMPFIERMRKGDLQDPLLKQVLPLDAELQPVPGFVTDPLAEMQNNPHDGLIHKYRGRVLLITTSACAINCRYCFRRHFPYQENRLGPDQWQRILDYIAADDSIHEVLFSGGDPLAAPDGRIARMLNELAAIAHLRRVRFHSRLPVVIPQRITDQLIAALTGTRLKPILVLHANHANEIDAVLSEALQPLRQARVPVLNQAVLLKGVNDSVEALKTLSETLFDAGVLPYYLFVLDPVAGSAHFDVSDDQARKLFDQLQRQLPGYLVPKLAREIPGEPSKTLLI